MSELIAAKVKGELLERFRDEEEKLGEDETTSELVRDLLDRGLRDRTTPLFARLGLPNRVAARLEADREDGEPDEEVIRRFLREAVEARDDDALDAIGSDDDLREAVEGARGENEALDDAVRRLVREGVEASGPSTRTDRITASLAVFMISMLPLAIAIEVGFVVGTAYAVFFGIVTYLGPHIERVSKYFASRLKPLSSRVTRSLSGIVGR